MNRYSSIIKKTITFFKYEDKTVLGRWSIKDNKDIKQSLANMDSCGDSLCGTPSKYTDAINSVLNKKP
tara:strand:- start:508 stop:711 length:204 start_codon:yes stop_codon:yes gene_type:complete